MRKIVNGLVALCMFVATTGRGETAPFDHSAFDSILGETVQDGVVDYGKIRDRYADLQGYLKQLETADVETLSREERLAFYINAYNAHCINGVLSNGEIESVNDVPRFFKKTKFVLAGRPQSLDSLEHKILRKMDEPRMHFAIVCSSVSCPKLASTAYTGATLNKDLIRQTQDFFRDTTKNRFDSKRGIFHLSKIMKWFRDDFIQDKESVLAFVFPYMSERDRAFYKAAKGRMKVAYLEYDWGLNGSY